MRVGASKVDLYFFLGLLVVVEGTSKDTVREFTAFVLRLLRDRRFFFFDDR